MGKLEGPGHGPVPLLPHTGLCLNHRQAPRSSFARLLTPRLGGLPETLVHDSGSIFD